MQPRRLVPASFEASSATTTPELGEAATAAPTPVGAEPAESLGPVLAAVVAVPAWFMLVVAAPDWTLLRLAVVAGFVAYAGLVWAAVIAGDRADAARRAECAHAGPPRTRAEWAATWLAVGGFSAAPAAVGILPVGLLVLALPALVATVVAVSPRLSRDAADVVERVVAGPAELRPLAATPDDAGMASVWSAVQASQGERPRVPPRWHPCQGARGAVRHVRAELPARTGTVRLFAGGATGQ